MKLAETPAAIEFGRFRVMPRRREFLIEGRPLELGWRAFDVLMGLMSGCAAVVSKDRLVSKDTLMKRVWPDRIVEENNLQAQISVLRRVLAADRDLIRTIAGQGYQFTGEIRSVSAQPQAPASAAMPQPTPALPHPPTNLPELVSELIGRDAELHEILDLSASHRLVTLTGAGGIGKTRLALAVARRLLPQFADGAWLAEFSPLTGPGLVAATVAGAVGLELSGGEVSTQRIAHALAGRRMLLVMDTC